MNFLTLKLSSNLVCISSKEHFLGLDGTDSIFRMKLCGNESNIKSMFKKIIQVVNEPTHVILLLKALSSGEGSGSGEHVQMHRLTRAFTAHILKVVM